MAKNWIGILQSNEELMRKVTLWECNLEGIKEQETTTKGENSTEIYKRMRDVSSELPHKHPVDDRGTLDADTYRSGNNVRGRAMKCRQILISFFIFDKETCYVQGMTQMVMVFLRVGMSAENALKCFVGFIDRMCLRECYLEGGDGMDGSSAKAAILAEFLAFSPKWGRKLAWGTRFEDKTDGYPLYLRGKETYGHITLYSGPAGQVNCAFFQDLGIAEPVKGQEEVTVTLFDYMITRSSDYGDNKAMVIFMIRIAMLDFIVGNVERMVDIENAWVDELAGYSDAMDGKEFKNNPGFSKTLIDLISSREKEFQEKRFAWETEFKCSPSERRQVLEDIEPYRKGPVLNVRNGVRTDQLIPREKLIITRINDFCKKQLGSFRLTTKRGAEIIKYCEDMLDFYKDRFPEIREGCTQPEALLQHLNPKLYKHGFPVYLLLD